MIHLPTLNACLNGLAAIFLLLGFVAIRRERRDHHRSYMLAAFVTSAAFLASYLYYHFTVDMVTVYPGQGLGKIVYYIVLFTHIPLATLMVPFLLLALKHAFAGEFTKHVRITKWLYPVWLYVSVTGVVIYLMLYVFVASGA